MTLIGLGLVAFGLYFTALSLTVPLTKRRDPAQDRNPQEDKRNESEN